MPRSKATARAASRWRNSSAMPVLARAWQMLLKGIGEAQAAPSPLEAAEMVLVRLAYVADLPTPAELAKSLDRAPAAAPAQAAAPVSRPALAPAGPITRSAAAAEPARVLAPTAVPASDPAPRADLPNPRAFSRSSSSSTSTARHCSARISMPTCISCVSSPAASSCARPRPRRAISPTGSASSSPNGPGGAGW